MQIFEENHFYVKNYSYICNRVSSTLRVGVRFNGSNFLKRAVVIILFREFWTNSVTEDSSNMLTLRLCTRKGLLYLFVGYCLLSYSVTGKSRSLLTIRY